MPKPQDSIHVPSSQPKKKLPYYKMYPNDFDADEKVRSLDCREAGLFLFALNHAWNNDGLPNDDAQIGKLLKIPVRDFREAWPTVKGCFTLCDDGRLRNQRQEEERQAAISKSRKAADSASSRWSEPMRTHSERSATETQNASLRAFDLTYESESVVVETSEEEKTPTRAKEIVSLGRFSDWWSIWSDVRGTANKQESVQAWLSVVTTDLVEPCIECTRSYVESLDDPRKGFNPENFIFKQAKDAFSARWPKARDSPTGDRNQKRRDEVLAGIQYFRGMNEPTRSV